MKNIVLILALMQAVIVPSLVHADEAGLVKVAANASLGAREF